MADHLDELDRMRGRIIERVGRWLRWADDATLSEGWAVVLDRAWKGQRFTEAHAANLVSLSCRLSRLKVRMRVMVDGDFVECFSASDVAGRMELICVGEVEAEPDQPGISHDDWLMVCYRATGRKRMEVLDLYLRGMSSEEVGSLVGLRPSHAKTVYNQAISKIREWYGSGIIRGVGGSIRFRRGGDGHRQADGGNGVSNSGSVRAGRVGGAVVGYGAVG